MQGFNKVHPFAVWGVKMDVRRRATALVPKPRALASDTLGVHVTVEGLQSLRSLQITLPR